MIEQKYMRPVADQVSMFGVGGIHRRRRERRITGGSPLGAQGGATSDPSLPSPPRHILQCYGLGYIKVHKSETM